MAFGAEEKKGSRCSETQDVEIVGMEEKKAKREYDENL